MVLLLSGSKIVNIKYTRKVITTFLVLLNFIICYSQERVQTAKAYTFGDTLVAPLYGIHLIMPDKWTGYLTSGTEVFTLKCDTVDDINVFIFPTNEKLADIETRWIKGVEISPGIKVIPTGKLSKKDGILQGEFHFSNNNTLKAYGLSQCGDFNFCYTLLVVISVNKFAKYKNTLYQISDLIAFQSPTISDYYEEYNWKNQLTGKYLFTYYSGGGSTKGNHLWLCSNGTFIAKLQRKGVLKDEVGKYKGTHKGVYIIEGRGSKGKLSLEFAKLSTVRLDLEIKKGIIFMNQERYSVAEHQRCK